VWFKVIHRGKVTACFYLFGFVFFLELCNLSKTKTIMSDQTITNDSLSSSEFNKPLLPGGLNVLTILTFIGSGIQLLFSVFGFFNAEKSYREKDKVMAQMNSAEMPGWAKSMMPSMENYEEMITKSYENRLPIFILSVVALVLCIYVAMQMRSLKKQGYLFYVIGQVLPFATSALFIGTFAFAGTAFVVMTGLTILFILLYTMQRKHLIY